MPTPTYYPLIGFDIDRNEYPKEWPGKNWEDAAEALGKRFGYIEVKSNFSGQKRGGNGSGMYNRKPLWKPAEPPKEALKIPVAPPHVLEGLLTQTPDAFGLRLVKEPHKLIEMLRDRGFVFELYQRNGKSGFSIDRRSTCVVTDAELGQIRDLLRERRTALIDALQEETAGKTTDAEEPVDPLKGRKIQDIILAMLPQMPTPFTCDDLIARLRAADYAEFANDRARVTSNIQHAITKRQVEPVSRGRYRVKEEFRHRRAASESPPEHPLREAFESAIGEEPAVGPVGTPPVDPQAGLPLELFQPPREVIAVAPPEPEPEPQIQPETAPLVNGHRVLVATLLDLASQAVADGGDDMLSLADKLDEAFQQCESSVLDALTVLRATAKPLVEQARSRAAAKQTILRSLSLPDQKLR